MGALSAVAATACFTELARRHFGRTARRAGARSGSASARRRCWPPTGCRSRSARRSGLAAALALQRDRPAAGSRAGGAQRDLQPGRRPVRGDGRPGLRAGGRAARACRSSAGTGSRWRRAALMPPVLLTRGVPRGRLRAVPVHRLRADPAVRAAPRWWCCRARERTLRDRRGPLRAGRDAGAAGAHRHGRQRRAPGRAGGRAGAGLRAGRRAACAPARGAARGARSRALLFWQWSPAARDLYKAATDPVAKASYFDPVREYLRLLPDQRRVEIPFTLGHWEGAEVALGGAARARLAAPARHRAPPDLLQGRHEPS